MGLTPGVTGIQAPTTTFNPETTNHYSSGGKGANVNTLIVDGLDVDSDIGERVNNLTPNVDALSEVTVQTNTYTVDYGKSSSIQTVMSSRAGTAEFHGFASEYYTYQGLQAEASSVYLSRRGRRRSIPLIYPLASAARSFRINGSSSSRPWSLTTHLPRIRPRP